MPGQTSIGGDYYSVKLKDRKKNNYSERNYKLKRQKNNKDRFRLGKSVKNSTSAFFHPKN